MRRTITKINDLKIEAKAYWNQSFYVNQQRHRHRTDISFHHEIKLPFPNLRKRAFYGPLVAMTHAYLRDVRTRLEAEDCRVELATHPPPEW